MGFLDKAKAAANDLAAKADTALSGAGMAGPGGGDAERYFRDLGVLAYLEWSGRPAPSGERERIMAALREMDARGTIRSYALHTAPPPAPGTGPSSGYGPTTPPPPAGGAPAGGAPAGGAPAGGAPGSGGPAGRGPGDGPGAAPPPPPQPAPQPPAAPPPPPSWMKDGGTA
ncbi:hypothetical protein [Georgenia muralis]|uniref:hypothetical protein n=1 Tax=Georgenia muralis TaxID=154117 RepID=UPI000F508825|nr:hypothetical protein [Georgenia muralis]